MRMSQSTSGGPGQVSAIENAASLTSSPTISTTLPVGRGPVYGVMTVDDRRAFILNQTDGTVSVINVQNNALDTPMNTIPVGPRPVWADLASGLDELVVANEGNGTTPGLSLDYRHSAVFGVGAADESELRSDEPDRRDGVWARWWRRFRWGSIRSWCRC